MRIRLHDDIAAFVRLAGPLYDADPVRHTMAITVLDGVRDGRKAPALMVTAHRGSTVVGAAFRVEGRGVIVSGLPAVCAADVDAVAATVDPAPWGVTGPVAQAHAYASAVAARTGGRVEVAMRQRLFRLVVLQCPSGVPGSARQAVADDVELLARWQEDFMREALPTLPTPDDPRPGLRDVLARGGGIQLWEVDGEPVAYAAARTPIAAMSRVGPVYTPSAHRGHGYGTAVTAAATAWALDAGARDVVLFTDLSNPVSNAIYPRIGYRAVEDMVELAFG
ncbi:GNAT family N-acetyltransferase [Pseudonocardia sp.]|uniref:GNAT family N-acetyltransferase n=1 Tax=Pseudonocardia sp. TaxID=60912 RepID=UPI003D14569B